MLDDNRRAQLDGIVQKMHANGESDEAIQMLVDDFKGKYAQPDKGSALSRFGSALADAIPEPIRHPSMFAEVPGAVMDLARENPMALVNPMSMIGNDIANQSIQTFQDQRAKGTNLASSLAAGIPVVGPAAAQVGEEIGQGDYASAAGHAIPLLAPFVAKDISRAAGAVTRPVGAATRTGATVAKNAALGAVKTGATNAFDALLEGKGFSGGAAHGLKGAAKGGFEAGKAAFEARKALAKVVEDHPVLAERVAPILKETPAPKKLTVAQKNAKLKELGWRPKDYNKLTPAEANRVIEAGETWPPGKGSMSASIGEPATGVTNKGYSSKSPNEKFARNNTPNAKVAATDEGLSDLLQQSIENPRLPKSIKKPEVQAEVIADEIIKLRQEGKSRVKISSEIAKKYGLPVSNTNFVVADFLKSSGL